MTIAQLTVLALKLSIIVIALALGLKTAPSDWVWLLRRPALLARSLISMNVIMPLFAIAAVKLMHLRLAVAVALLALSFAPAPPMLPRKATSGYPRKANQAANGRMAPGADTRAPPESCRPGA